MTFENHRQAIDEAARAEEERAIEAAVSDALRSGSGENDQARVEMVEPPAGATIRLDLTWEELVLLAGDREGVDMSSVSSVLEAAGAGVVSLVTRRLRRLRGRT